MDIDRLADLRSQHRSPRRPPLPPIPPPSTVRWLPAPWTAGPPTAGGLYHYRDPARPHEVLLAHVRRNAAGVLVARFVHGEEPVADRSGEWAGPLTLTVDD